MAITIGKDNQQIGDDGRIRTALDDGLNVRVAAGDTWTFPKTGTDGRVGKLCVSRFRPVTVAHATEPLAVHITFTIKQLYVPGEDGATRRQEKVRVEVQNLHFTARPRDVQFSINGDNFVAALPDHRDVATHRGEVNDWLHNKDSEKLKDIAVKIGLKAGTKEEQNAAKTAIDHALEPYSGTALSHLKTAIIKSFQVEINDNLQPVRLRGHVPIEVKF